MPGFKDFMKKFGKIAIMEAPLIVSAMGLPPEVGQAIGIGVAAAQQMQGATNEQKAQQAATIAKQVLGATNAVLTNNGHPPLVDETVSDDALNHAIKITYDITKMKNDALTTTNVAGQPTGGGNVK